MTLRDRCDKTVNILAGNQQRTSFAIKQSTKMISWKLVVILWIACSTTWVQAYVDDDGFRNSLESGDKYHPNPLNFEDDPRGGGRGPHQRPPYGFDPNLDDHHDFHQPRFHVNPLLEDNSDLHWPGIHPEPHPDLHRSDVHPEPHPDLHWLDVHSEPHPEVPEVINLPQEDPVPLAPYPVTAPNSGHLLTEAQPVTPVSNDSPHSAQTPEELYETEKSSSTFSTESSSQTEDNYLEFKLLKEPPTDSKSEESFMEMIQIPLIVGIVLGAMISLLIFLTVVYVSCRLAKPRKEYTVEMSHLRKKNKEITEV